MIKNILFFIIPLVIYAILSNFIEDFKNLILISLLITTIIFWATSIIPNYQTSLIFLFACLGFSLSSKEIIFSGFASSAFWLVLAGMLIATAIKNVNLSQRFSVFFTNIKNPSYLKILITIDIFSLLFSFVMPSSLGRVVLLIPIAIIVAKNFGFKETDKGYIGIMLTFILATVIPAFAILP
ncbi:anion permease, partial [Aliarcobacter butzleri]